MGAQSRSEETPQIGAFGKFIALHGYASATPASDGNAVYTFFGHSGVFAFDLDGSELWRADVGSNTHGFGTGTSPILYKDLVIVNASVESSSLVALDKRSGKEAWRAQVEKSWNTPVLVEAPGGPQEVVVNTEDKLRAFNPGNGQSLWHCAGSQPPRYICPSAVAHGGVVYALHGYFGPLAAIRAGGRGDVAGSHLLWQTTDRRCGSNVSSPV